ncbi:MAG: HdeD family acid-resistance protein [Bryobacterales bacterium]|nr:HdeD family acid-resistance protein [Bryobacterales bacterium]MBV9399347.1 HdeD family acid-resistance protein [Bryobacterales bacterium]
MGISTSWPLFSTTWQEQPQKWGWLLALGIISIVLGVIALMDAVTVTVVSMLFFGWILVIWAVVEAVQTFRHRRGGHMLLHTLNAVLSFVVGVMLIRNPIGGALIITLLIAAYLTVLGIFRIVAAIALRTPEWHWTLLSGVITLFLGILVWDQWPTGAFWIIGLFIGIHLIFTGWAEVMLAFAVRRLRSEPALTSERRPPL